MTKILIYTFRTFPYLEELKKVFPDVVVFGKLKEDIDSFCQKILNERPEFILGVAKSEYGYSVFEPKAVNKFGSDFKVLQEENEELKLFIPNLADTSFMISSIITTTFCNYSMFKIKSFLDSQKLDVKFAFVHICEKDVKELVNVIK